MRILINDKPVDALTPRQKKSFRLSRAVSEVKATVLTPAEATQAYIAETWRWFLILGGLAVIVMLGAAVAGPFIYPMNDSLISVGALIICAGFVLVMYLLLGHRVRTWNSKLAHRSEGLPPAGTANFLDARGLSVGSETFARPSLAIDQVELRRTSASSGETSTVIHIVDRLSLSAGTKTVVLDRTMLQNGLLLVDNAWRKLRARLLTPPRSAPRSE
jgi:hypothetical protein